MVPKRFTEQLQFDTDHGKRTGSRLVASVLFFSTTLLSGGITAISFPKEFTAFLSWFLIMLMTAVVSLFFAPSRVKIQPVRYGSSGFRIFKEQIGNTRIL